MMRKKLIERRYVASFCLITCLFALWGFANDITNPMVAAFQTVMELSAFEASWVQFAFYGGYATMAIPAALFIQRYSYKKGILLGLGLYALGAFLFVPAAEMESFLFFCLSLYILTFGLAFLETTANPFILSLGAKETSTRRLNLAQAFNPLGSLTGMAVASTLVLPNLLSDRRNALGETFFHTLEASEKASIRAHDLGVIRDPYVYLGVVVLLIFLVIGLKKMPHNVERSSQESSRLTMHRLWKNGMYVEGVVAQMFYVAAQIMVWTFIIQYADTLGICKAQAQNYNILAMMLFLCGRFVSTLLMRYFSSRALLAVFGLCASLCMLGTVCFVGMHGLWCLVVTSAFMSLMFPSIYGIALEGVEQKDTSLGAAFLVMAIVGGAVMPPLQGWVIDHGEICGVPAVNVSFLLPLICFVVVTTYGLRTLLVRRYRVRS